jgi:hypothetical protein
VEREGVSIDERTRASPGVVGNARLTAATGAVIFVLLAIEGVTVLRVDELLALHVFVGVLLIPVAVLKVGTATYRAARYYLGAADYARKGPPPVVLRSLGPLARLDRGLAPLTFSDPSQGRLTPS